MGAGCDRMKDVSSRVWRWFFPKRIEAPECVLELLRFVYPTVDWSRVSFYEGWPHVTDASDNKAITLPDTYSPHRIHVYFKPGEWNPCSRTGLGLIVHEAFHVLQIQELLGGWGLGLARPFIVHYLACWPAHGYADHPMEKAAYVVAGRSNPPSLFEACCTTRRRACDCSTDSPSIDSAGLAAFQAACAHVVQRTSGISFWKDIARCTPGLLRLHRAAKRLFDWGCRSGDRDSIPVPTGPGPGPTDPDRPRPAPVDGEDDDRGTRIPLWPFTCLSGLVGAGSLYIVSGLYYALWLLAWSVITVVLWLARILVEIVGVIVSAVLWAVTGIVCAAEWVWDQLKKLWT